MSITKKSLHDLAKKYGMLPIRKDFGTTSQCGWYLAADAPIPELDDLLSPYLSPSLAFPFYAEIWYDSTAPVIYRIFAPSYYFQD